MKNPDDHIWWRRDVITSRLELIRLASIELILGDYIKDDDNHVILSNTLEALKDDAIIPDDSEFIGIKDHIN